ncbi:MAG: CD225/dispanin family protein [Prevotella sp.]|nr:CD225/dispanin family protein [Prevotella sp.]
MNSYYYLNEKGEQMGPVEGSELLTRGVMFSTLVWTPGMKEWKEAGTIDELRPLFTPPQNPYQTSYDAQERPSRQERSYGYSAETHTGQPDVAPPRPDNYMVWAIITTICCCLPLGIYSIVLSSRVNGYYMAKRYDEAYAAAEEAKKWVIITAVVGFVMSFAYGILSYMTALGTLSS